MTTVRQCSIQLSLSISVWQIVYNSSKNQLDIYSLVLSSLPHSILTEAKSVSLNATAAFKAYSNIKANIDAAEKEAKSAKQRASEALDLVSGDLTTHRPNVIHGAFRYCASKCQAPVVPTMEVYYEYRGCCVAARVFVFCMQIKYCKP